MEFVVNLNEDRNNKVQIFINNEFFGMFSKKTIDQLKLKNNIFLNTEQFNSLQKILENKCCKPKALQLLSRRDYSKKELIQKLEKIANSKTANKIVENLQKLNLVNDIRYAENLARNLILNKHYGKNKVLYELKLKGISFETAKQTIENLKIDPIDPIIKLIKKKYINNLRNFKDKQKVVRALLQKGHEYSTILEAISLID